MTAPLAHRWRATVSNRRWLARKARAADTAYRTQLRRVVLGRDVRLVDEDELAALELAASALSTLRDRLHEVDERLAALIIDYSAGRTPGGFRSWVMRFDSAVADGPAGVFPRHHGR